MMRRFSNGVCLSLVLIGASACGSSDTGAGVEADERREEAGAKQEEEDLERVRMGVTHGVGGATRALNTGLHVVSAELGTERGAVDSATRLQQAELAAQGEKFRGQARRRGGGGGAFWSTSAVSGAMLEYE